MTDPTNPFQNRNDIMRDAAYKSGFNDALEQVAKWHDERVDAAMKRAAISNYRYQQVHDLTVADIHNVSSAHVRSMKKP